MKLREEFQCDFMPSGLLALVGEGEFGHAQERVARTREAGFEAELLDAAAIVDCEPLLRHRGRGLLFPQDGSIHPLKLAAGIADWLRGNGVRICLDQEVRTVGAANGAVTTEAGRVSAGAVVVAAGAWTPLLTGLLGWSPPIRPIRGTLLASDAQEPGTLRTVVIGKRYYYWQLAAGPVAAGGSEEDVGFEEGVDADVEADIVREHGSLFPALSDTVFTSRWSGFRPFCRDQQPVIGRIPGRRDVYVSAGHFRKGVMLAPLSGEILADRIGGGGDPTPEAFRPDRFPPGRPDGGARRQSPGES